MEALIENQLLMLAKLLGAMALGGAIGLEREIARRPAGLRTHMLVATAAALVIIMSRPMLHFYLSTELDRGIAADPFRLVEAVLTGIAVLGAGAIIQRGISDVHGLTTASSLLFAGAVGMAAALELWLLAAGATFFAIFFLRLLERFERWFENRRD